MDKAIEVAGDSRMRTLDGWYQIEEMQKAHRIFKSYPGTTDEIDIWKYSTVCGRRVFVKYRGVKLSTKSAVKCKICGGGR